MKHKGTGSKVSPIAIDDSEEEVVLELNVTNPGPTTRSQSAKDQEGRLLQRHMAHPEANFNGYSHQKDRDFQLPGGQKRKRTHVDQHDGHAAGPSHPRLPASSLETRVSNVSSKKARKRRRKLERQAMETETSSKHQFWLNGMNQLLTPFSWAPDTLQYNVLDPLLPVSPFVNGNQPYPNLAQDPRPKISYMSPPPSFNDRPQFDTKFNDAPIASTSAWVSSMAMAAENPAQLALEAWTPPPHPPQSSHPQWPTTPLLTPITPHPVHPLPPKPPAEQPSVNRGPVEPHKPPPPPIGMLPDHDPSSKHGIFEPGPGASRLPNPARTLVIEQLPKSHRNADWVNAWCKSACGAHPVHLSINAQGAKALVEFATSELARKAWGSPRLGSSYAGLKSHQLKGKPREDLIKVWWYRVDGIGAGSGVGEIEEGEIEGDAAEKEVEVPVKKESKKERKARIAKEKLEKQKKQLEVTKMSAETHPHPQHAPTIRPLASLPKRPPQIYTSSLSRPGLPTPVLHQHGDQEINPSSSISQSFPSPLSYHRQQPASRPPLLPQSELRTHWKEHPESAKKVDKTSYGSSVRQQANSVNDTDSESIASSRSPSPVQLSPSVPEAPPPSASMISVDEQPDIMDVDDVSIDMELSSPVNSRHLQPPPRSCSVPPHPSLPLSAPAPRIALHAPIPSPEPNSLAPMSTLYSTSRAPSAQNNLRPLSSSSAHTSTPHGTPPLEPRAMKNAPKAPSYQKRSLLARKKELEERIARSRLELGLESLGVTDSSPITPMTPSDPSMENNNTAEKDAMEERLRTLVLQSQRSKLKAGAPPTPPTTESSSSLSTGATSSSSSNSSTGAVTPAPAASDAPPGFSLDDLAVSFIQETIQTYKTSPRISPAVPVPVSKPKLPSQANLNLNTRLELAAKQKRLELEIAETKTLMAKLAQARTKQEKDTILAEMREKSRTAGEDASNSSMPRAASDQPSVKVLIAQTSINWPKSHRDAGVLIVSDDEDDSDSDDDDMD